MTSTPPDFPAGAYQEPDINDLKLRLELIRLIATVPDRVRESVGDLTEEQLDTKYRNWSIRQIVHHLADSHMNCYIRFKWALTEDSPLIKAYDEGRWSEIVDATSAPIDSSLAILDGLHARWADLLNGLDDTLMQRTFFHPELMKDVSLAEALPNYVWHADHHVAQIQWIRNNQDW